MNPILLGSIFVLVFISGISVAYGHKTVEAGPYQIEVGWEVEPPIVGIRNSFVFIVTESPSEGVKSGVTNAFKNLEATAKSGGITKSLSINSESKPGNYFSPVIPTKVGTISIELKGEIRGTPVDFDITIEDVESTAILDFPPVSGSSSDKDVTILKNAMSSLQKDVAEIKSGGVGSSNLNVGPAYDFAVLGLSLGAAGVILAVIAMIKRK